MIVSLDEARRERAAARPSAPATQLRSAPRDEAAYAAGILSLDDAMQACVLGALAAADFRRLLQTVTEDWPAELGAAAVTLTLKSHDEAHRFERGGTAALSARKVQRWHEAATAPELRAVHGDHPLFAEGSGVRTAAVVPVTLPEPLGAGLLAIGMREGGALEALGGAERLGFLGAALSRMLGVCLTRSF
ncbi:MAG: hypothetical protein V2J26_03700 [Pacificimonas sp.]|jgi:uncharacterized protein YigA (DUF484 family)|nr:hypothetical protein [Pacificimonas sp.]